MRTAGELPGDDTVRSRPDTKPPWCDVAGSRTGSLRWPGAPVAALRHQRWHLRGCRGMTRGRPNVMTAAWESSGLTCVTAWNSEGDIGGRPATSAAALQGVIR